MRYLLLIPLLGLLVGCQTITPQQCSIADWYQVGYEDGTKGRDSLYVSNYSKPCSSANIIPNRVQWERGRQEGFKRFCTVPVAHSEGLSGNKFSSICPVDSTHTARYNAWYQGYQIFELKRQVRNNEGEYSFYLREYERTSGKEREASWIRMNDARTKANRARYELSRLGIYVE